MKFSLQKALNIRKGEESSIKLLLIYSFFIGSATAFFISASTSIFLTSFERGMLPYAYIAGGITVYLLGLIYTRIQKKFDFSQLLKIVVLFLLFSVFVLTIFYFYAGFKIFAFLLFAWIRVFVFVNGVSFGAISTKIFDLQQGKRLYGLINTGEVISFILGFFSIPFILKFTVTESLLFIPVISLLICVFIMFKIIKKFKEQLSIKIVSKSEKIKGKNKFTDLFKNKYYFNIFLLAMLPILGAVFVDYIFNAQAKIEFPDKKMLTGFIGILFGIIMIIEFILKTFLTGRLISKYGIKLGLIILPLALIFSFTLSSVSGTLYGTAAMFFSFIMLSKLFTRSLRSSFHDPAFQILYQPLAPEERLSVQSKIEGGPKALGNAIAGVLLLILTFSGLNLVQISYIFIIILAFWATVGFRMYKEYRLTLKDIIFKQKKKSAKELEKEEKQIHLNQQIALLDVQYFRNTINILERIAPEQINELIEEILDKSSLEIKSEIIHLVKSKKIVFPVKLIENLLIIETDKSHKELLQEIYNLLAEIEDIPFSEITNLSKSDNPKDREYAAKLLSICNRYNAYKLIINLIHDENTIVKKHAIIAAGKIKRVELWPHIIDNLSLSAFNNTAISAIKMIGEQILDDLEIFFHKMGNNKQIQIQIIRLIKHIGSKKAVEILRSKINYHNKDVKSEILISLSNMEYSANVIEIPFIKQAIEEEISITVWLMASILDIGDAQEYAVLTKALETELHQKQQNIFLLLSLIYDSKTMQHVFESIKKDDKDSRMYALEIIDMTLSEDIKELLVPLVDDLSIADCINNYYFLFPQEKLSLIDRLIDIINKDFTKINRWTKANAIRLLKDFDYKLTARILTANLINPDPVLAETSAWALYNSNPDKYFESIVTFKKSDLDRLQPTTDKLKTGINDFLLNIDKVKILKQTDLFDDIPKEYLSELAISTEELLLKKGEILSDNPNADNSIYIVANGQIESIIDNIQNKSFGNYSAILAIGNEYSNKTYKAKVDTQLIQINVDDLDDLELMTDDANIIKKIVFLLNKSSD
ncbi:MAG: hypothetical protein K9J13_07385 [Saprospiraceae bacterium]|nr:hypothetical protein [Saprospiraceae bacterium]